MPSADDDTVVGTLPGTPGEPADAPRIGARYQIVRWLGGGGMGRVYEALDVELGEHVALKVLRGGPREDSIERFRREVRLTRKIQHPNVARMYDLGEHEGDRFLTMELIDGASLTAELGRVVPWPRLRAIALQLCAGLAAAHDKGVIHRDLKPDNVLVERGTDRVVITDFGIARGADDPNVTREGAVVGTPRYMAPEQLTGGELDARADLFALGVVLYELASGTRPWDGDTAVAIAVAHLTEPARPLRAAVPAELAALVMSCLALDRAARPASARALGDAIAAIAPDAAVSAEPTPPPRPAAVAHPTPTRLESTLAVLPFHGAPADAYLAEGVQEDLIDMLSTTPGLRVRPAGAASRGDRDPRDVGRELAVDHVIVGSLRRTPTGIRIAARLINVADGFQVWAHRIDGDDAAVLEISGRLGQAIADALSTRAAPPDRPTDARAVDLYLRARAELKRYWGEHVRAATDLLDEAARLAPDSGPIVAMRAIAAVQTWTKNDGAEALARARHAVDGALALDHPDAYIASALLRSNLGDMEGHAADARIALARAPMSSYAHEITGRLMVEVESIAVGRHHLETARALDPLRAQLIELELGRLAAFEGDFEPLERTLAVLAHDPDPAMRTLAAVCEARMATWQRDLARALGTLGRMAKAPPQIGSLPVTLSNGRLDLAAYDALWHHALRGAMPSSRPRRGQLLMLQRAVETAIASEHLERATEALRRAIDLGLMDVIWLDRCPLFAAVDDPGFRALRDEVAARAARVRAAFRGERHPAPSGANRAR